MSAFHDIILAGAAGQQGYKISRSVRLRSSASASFTRTPASSSNRRTNTFSFWLKRGALGTQTIFDADAGSMTFFVIQFDSSDRLRIANYLTTANIELITTQVFRDPSAWYHVVVSIDTTQATAANRVRLFINGVQVTAFSTATYPAQNALTNALNETFAHAWGAQILTYGWFDGYLTEINFIDGQALTPSSFGETNPVTGVWQPKKYAGTYGTNGFYLNFSDPSAATAAAIGKDYSGNGNNWTPNNISVTAGATYDSMLDVPTMWADGGNGRGNYCTLTPLAWRFAIGQGAFSEGNLKFTYSGASSAFGYGTIGVSTGKWYFEGTLLAVGTATPAIGIADSQTQWGTFTNLLEYAANGQRPGGSGWATFTTNDVIGVAFDLDASTLSFYKNNVLSGTVSISAGVTYFPLADSVLNAVWAMNFGQRPFTYTPPTGFKALNTQNLPDSTIKAGNKYFDATTYSGSASTVNVVNGGFQPDLVWAKSRNLGATHQAVYDSVRGFDKLIKTNATDAEVTYAPFASVNSNGYSMTSGDSNFNTAGNTYVGWQWKKGATQGFDIVTYTGNGTSQNIAHSLGVAPKMMIVKQRSGVARNWFVYHASLGATQCMEGLNTTSAATTQAAWNNTSPTSSVFSVGANSGTNNSADTYVAYLFSEVAGFSKFGSYTGNGSADGAFVFTGFLPRFILLKAVDATNANDWVIIDTARKNYNADGVYLRPNLSNAEGDDSATPTNGIIIDVLSNGFKLRGTSTRINGNGSTVIFAAFASNPFKNSLAQ